MGYLGAIIGVIIGFLIFYILFSPTTSFDFETLQKVTYFLLNNNTAQITFAVLLILGGFLGFFIPKKIGKQLIRK